MSVSDYQRNAQLWLDTQSSRHIDYEWELRHHNQMHAAYEQSLKA